jgi:hypothetical protein
VAGAAASKQDLQACSGQDALAWLRCLANGSPPVSCLIVGVLYLHGIQPWLI